jgi:hypothetical protein
MVIDWAAGAFPSSFTTPVIVPAVAGSTGLATTADCVGGGSSLLHAPATSARPTAQPVMTRTNGDLMGWTPNP